MAQLIDPTSLAASDLDGYLTQQGFNVTKIRVKQTTRLLTLTERNTVTIINLKNNLAGKQQLGGITPPIQTNGFITIYKRGIHKVTVCFMQDPTITDLSDNQVISVIGTALIQLDSGEILIL